MEHKRALIGYSETQLLILKWVKYGGGMVDSVTLAEHIVQLVTCGALTFRGTISEAKLMVTDVGEKAIRVQEKAA